MRHAVIKEEIFYPAVSGKVGAKLMNEADEEHHVTKVLIAELDASDRKNVHRDAKSPPPRRVPGSPGTLLNSGA